jgi:LysM repeat protein
MAFTLDEIRQLIRGALTESKVPQTRTGKAYIVGTKGIDSTGSLVLECEIRIKQDEYKAIRSELINTYQMFPLPGPPQIRGRGEGYVTFGGSYETHGAYRDKDDDRSPREAEFNEFIKAIKTNSTLREWLRSNSPHHGSYNYGIFPTMTRSEWEDFVKIWRAEGYSEEAGGWPDGTEYHSTYDKDNNCCHCEARFSTIRGTGDCNLTKTRPQIHPRWKSQKLSEGGRHPGSGGWCCGDPVRPVRLFKKIELQAAYRPGSAGLRPRVWCDRCGVTRLPEEVGENQYRCPTCSDVLPMSTLDAIYLDSPGPKTKEWLQYENTEVALYVFDDYRADVIKTIKERLDLPKKLAKTVYGEDDEYIKYKIPNRKYSKSTNVAPPDLHHYAYEAPQGVELQPGIWRIYNIEVDIQFNAGHARWRQQYRSHMTDYDDIPENDIYARQQWDQAHEKLLDQEDEEQGFFSFLTKRLRRIISKQEKEKRKFGKVYAKPNGTPIPYVDMNGRHYTVRYIETGLEGLNFLIDPFMPYKKKELAKKKIDLHFSQLPNQYDESWGFFGRRDQILSDDLREWFAMEFHLHLAPWKQSRPFPIDEKGNIYFIVEDEILVLDIDGTVDWGSLQEKERETAQTVYLHKNDTLESLAKRFKIPVQDLAEFNDLKPGDQIPGNKILIPQTLDPNYEAKQEYQKERQEELDAQLRSGEITQEQYKEHSEPTEAQSSPDPYFQKLGKTPLNELQQQLKQQLKQQQLKPSRPELRGSTIGYDGEFTNFKVIRNGCGVIRSICSIGDQILRMKKPKSLEDAHSILKHNLELASKELFELAKACTKDSSGNTVFAEIIARSRTLNAAKNKAGLNESNVGSNPHVHRINPSWIAWSDSAAYDTDLHIGLDEGKYWTSSRMSDRNIYRKANGGGSKDWYILNIKRIKDVPFLPPPGKRIKCGACKGKKETLEGPCGECLSTGYNLIMGVDLVRNIIADYRKVKNKEAKPTVSDPKLDFETDLIVKALRGDEWEGEPEKGTKTTGRGRGWRKTRSEHEADVVIARDLMQHKFFELISDYDRSLIIPHNPNKPEEQYVYDLNEKTQTWNKIAHTGGRYGAVIKPKFKYVSANEDQPLGDEVPVNDLMFDLTELSQLDLLALHYNWLGAGQGPRQLQKVPFGDPTRNATLASFSDFWDNIMKLIRTGRYWGAQGFTDESEANDVSDIQMFLDRRIEEFFEQDLDSKLIEAFPSVFSESSGDFYEGFQNWRDPNLTKRLARVLLKYRKSSDSEIEPEMQWPKKVVNWVAQHMLEAADVTLMPYSLIQMLSRILVVSDLRAALPTLRDAAESTLNPEEVEEGEEETVSPIPFTAFKYTKYYGGRFVQDEKDRAAGIKPKRTTPSPPTPEEVAVADEMRQHDRNEEIDPGAHAREMRDLEHFEAGEFSQETMPGFMWGDQSHIDMDNFMVDVDDADIPGEDDMDINYCTVDDDVDLGEEDDPEAQATNLKNIELGLKANYLIDFAARYNVSIPWPDHYIEEDEAKNYLSDSQRAALRREAEAEILELKKSEEQRHSEEDME